MLLHTLEALFVGQCSEPFKLRLNNRMICMFKLGIERDTLRSFLLATNGNETFRANLNTVLGNKNVITLI